MRRASLTVAAVATVLAGACGGSASNDATTTTAGGSSRPPAPTEPASDAPLTPRERELVTLVRGAWPTSPARRPEYDAACRQVAEILRTKPFAPYGRVRLWRELGRMVGSGGSHRGVSEKCMNLIADAGP